MGFPRLHSLQRRGTALDALAVASGCETLARRRRAAASPALCHLGSAVRKTTAFLKHLNFAVEPQALSNDCTLTREQPVGEDVKVVR